MAATTAFTRSGMSAFVRGVSSADLSPSSDIAPRLRLGCFVSVRCKAKSS